MGLKSLKKDIEAALIDNLGKEYINESPKGKDKIDKLSKALAKAFTDYIQRQNFAITEMQAPVLAPPPVGGKGMAVLTKSGKNTIGDPLAQANWPTSEVKAVRIDTKELG